MAFAASRQHGLARRLAKRLARDRMLRARSGTEELALAEPLVAAIMAFGRGDYDRAVESIARIRAAADRCGGSVAQCDLIHLTMLEAALRGHRQRLAQALAAERIVRKPASPLNRWLKARVDAGEPGDGLGSSSPTPGRREASHRHAQRLSILTRARFEPTGIGGDVDNHAHRVPRRERRIVQP